MVARQRIAEREREAQGVPLHENFEYQERPWEFRSGEPVVKGTSRRFELDESGCPRSKYAALFDRRPEFDFLRESFLHAACGHRLERLEECFGEYLEREVVIDEDATHAVLRSAEQRREHFGVAPAMSDGPTGFAEEAWLFLVDCMCDEGRQFS